MIELRVADEIGAIVREAVEVAILIGADRQRCSSLQRKDRGNRPVAREPARQGARFLQVIDLPHAGKDEVVRAIG